MNSLDNFSYVLWPMQDTIDNDVAVATNTALALGRSTALLTYGDYVAGANWSNPSGQIARHAAGATATLQQDGILAAGKTYQAKITVANRTAGSVTITDGGAAIDANGQATRAIASTGTDFIITPTSDFDGDIDVSLTLVQQTNIAASSSFPGADVIVNGNFATDTDWTKGDAAITISGGVATWSGAQAGNADLTADVAPLTNGLRYLIFFEVSGYSAGTITPLFGTQAGTGRTANGTYTEEVTANGTAFVMRGDATFAGNIDNVIVKPANPLNADHSNVTIGQPSGVPGLPYAAEYVPASNSYTDAYSAEINSILDPTSGCLFGLAKVSGAGVWADGAARYIARLRGPDNGEQIFLAKNAGNNAFQITYAAGGVLEGVTVTPYSPIDLFFPYVDWEVPGNMRAFIDGVQTGSSQAIGGTWVGNLSSPQTTIGALSTTPAGEWDGDLLFVGIGSRPLTAAENLQLARILGVA